MRFSADLITCAKLGLLRIKYQPYLELPLREHVVS